MVFCCRNCEIGKKSDGFGTKECRMFFSNGFCSLLHKLNPKLWQEYLDKPVRDTISEQEFNKIMNELETDIKLCKNCLSMTKTLPDNICGKCKGIKMEIKSNDDNLKIVRDSSGFGYVIVRKYGNKIRLIINNKLSSVELDITDDNWNELKKM